MHDHVGNTAALITVVGTVAGWLPPIAALFTIVWYGMMIYDKLRGK